MSPPVRKRPAAQCDLLEHCVAEDTFAALAAMPGMGRVEDLDDSRLTGMRRWRVRGFDI